MIVEVHVLVVDVAVVCDGWQRLVAIIFAGYLNCCSRCCYHGVATDVQKNYITASLWHSTSKCTQLHILSS